MQAQVTYSGNGNSGFGGTVGGSTLNISDDGTTMTFSFSRGGSNLDNVVVIYVDSKSGGFTNTNSFNDTGGADRVAISTTNGSRDPEVSFPSGFTADYAITAKNDFAGIFELQATGSHTFIDTADLTPNNDSSSATHTFTVDFSQIGITNTDKFDFVVTYCSGDSWLSNEVIGDTSNITAGTGASPNPGPDGSITFSDSKSYPNTWTGAVDNSWINDGNWTENIPTSTQNVHIPSGLTNYPSFDFITVSVNNLTMKSGASLIKNNGTFNGTIIYERNLASNNWYLVSSPVAGETIEALIANNDIDNTTGTSPNIGLAPYDNSQSVVTDRWDYQTASSTGSLVSGGGYSVKFNSAGNLKFIGTFQTGNVNVPITDGTGSGGNAFNLVGNPFSSFVSANSNANATNLLTSNSSRLTQETLWFWNQATSSYDEINQATAAYFIAPTQGFFVSANGSNNLNFLTGFQSNQSTDTFQKSATTRPEIKLFMTDGSLNRDAEIYYIDGKTTGFDNGYDSSIFGGFNHEFTVYTQAVANSDGKKLGIQSLPNTDLESMVIPVGVIAETGKEITFSAEALNLPSGLKVFLEDRTTNTFTRLDEANSNYKVTLTENTNGIGRFYLHTKSSALSTNDVSLENVSMYTVNKSTLKITGLSQGKSNIKVFNVLGKQVLNTSFQSNGVHEVSLPNLSTGLYIVQLENESGKLNKKIVLE